MGKTVVTVHGAGDGGWAWTPVAERLRAEGHRVFSVTLTGYGDRWHLASPAVTLATHVQDVVALCEYEQLHEVWLIGHSYGGWVTTVAAEQLAPQLAHLVYVDALVPFATGQRLQDLCDPSVVAAVEAQAGSEGWLVPRNPDLTDPRIGPVLWRPFQEAVTLQNPQAAALPRTYLAYTERGTNPRYQPIPGIAAAAAARGWRLVEVAGDHNAHCTHPELVAPVLAQLLSE